MKKINIYLLLVVFCIASAQSQCYITYTYDASGNRISRNNIGGCVKIGPGADEVAISKSNAEPIIKSSRESKEISIYPNPASTIVVLDIPDPSSVSHYTVINNQGQLIMQNDVIETLSQIDITSLIPSYYIITVWDRNKKIRYKNYFIKQ